LAALKLLLCCLQTTNFKLTGAVISSCVAAGTRFVHGEREKDMYLLYIHCTSPVLPRLIGCGWS